MFFYFVKLKKLEIIETSKHQNITTTTILKNTQNIHIYVVLLLLFIILCVLCFCRHALPARPR